MYREHRPAHNLGISTYVNCSSMTPVPDHPPDIAASSTETTSPRRAANFRAH
jgi:hypothetical protein